MANQSASGLRACSRRQALTLALSAGSVLALLSACRGPTIAYTNTLCGDFMKKLVTTVAGAPPELSYIDRYVTQTYACRGVLAPMDAIIGRSTVIKKEMFLSRLVNDTNDHGKTYDIPHSPDVGLFFI
ncbi:MAG TPA: hypothetical protein VGP33_08490 [Chloroflexota bacterium]|nr:hypothetical protein [Chloroflexota bacterium]